MVSDDLDTCETRIDIRCGAVRSDPLKDMFNGATIFNALTIAGDGCGGMKGRAHQVSVASASARDIEVHGAGDGVMFGEVGVDGRFDGGQVLGFIDREFGGALGV
jgi:hypothetical protein